MHAKNFAALLNKLNMRCLVNLYDVQKGMLFETTFLFDLSLEALSTLYTFFILCKQNDVINRSYKIVDDSKTKQGIKKILIQVCIIQLYH